MYSSHSRFRQRVKIKSSHSKPLSSSIPNMVHQVVGDLLQDPSLIHSAPGSEMKNITVVVSGSRFCIIPSLFRKVEKLPWTDILDVPHLNAHPDAFEVLLQYFLFNTLPDMSRLQKQRKELLQLVSVLDNAKQLEKHIETSPSGEGSKKKKQPSIGSKKRKSFLRKASFFQSNKTNKPFEGVVDPFAFEMITPVPLYNTSNNIDVPNVVATTTFDSEGSSTITKDDSVKSKDNKRKFYQSQASKRFQGWIADTKKKFPARKATHAEWCASEYVL